MKPLNMIFLLCFLFIVFMTPSCEQENILEDQAIRDEIIGDWKCNEESLYYKSIQNVYEVSIIGASVSDQIYVDNFYNITGARVLAEVNQYSINVLHDSIKGGYTIQYAFGTISDDFSQIEWSYAIDDGSGQIDSVTATYLKP